MMGSEFLLINPNTLESRNVFSRGHHDSNIAPTIRLLGKPPTAASCGGRRSRFHHRRQPSLCQPCFLTLFGRAKHVSEVGDTGRFGTVFELAAPGISISSWAGTARREPLAVLLHGRYSSSPAHGAKDVAADSRLREALGCAAQDPRARRTFHLSHTELVLLRTPIPPLLGGTQGIPQRGKPQTCRRISANRAPHSSKDDRLSSASRGKVASPLSENDPPIARVRPGRMAASISWQGTPREI